jgi:hypothetical protein
MPSIETFQRAIAFLTGWLPVGEVSRIGTCANAERPLVDARHARARRRLLAAIRAQSRRQV